MKLNKIKELTELEKEELKDLEDARFFEIGHEPTDYEMSKAEFIEHEKKIQEYLKANGRHNN